MVSTNKLSSLQEGKNSEKKDRGGIDLAGMQMKRWVKVLSKYKPMEREIGVLAKGLNFSITTECVPIKEIVTVPELVCQQLKHANGQPDEEAASKFRHKIVGIL